MSPPKPSSSFDPQQIRFLRHAACISQQQLAAAAGTSQSRISSIERGFTQPAPEELARLKTALLKTERGAK